MQRCSFNQLKRWGVNTDLINVNRLIQLFLFPGFDLNSPIQQNQGQDVTTSDWQLTDRSGIDVLIVAVCLNCSGNKSIHHSTSSGVMLSATGGAEGLYRETENTEEWEVDRVSEVEHECLEDSIIHSKNNPLNFSSSFATPNAPHSIFDATCWRELITADLKLSSQWSEKDKMCHNQLFKRKNIKMQDLSPSTVKICFKSNLFKKMKTN